MTPSNGISKRNHPLPEYLLEDKSRIPPYVFFVGRLEKDFAQAREAAGRRSKMKRVFNARGRTMADTTIIASVRERTPRLIEHASFVIALLALGYENPNTRTRAAHTRSEWPSPTTGMSCSVTRSHGEILIFHRRYSHDLWATEAS